jgi:uncharacterized membrane protein (UPF0127 family)
MYVTVNSNKENNSNKGSGGFLLPILLLIIGFLLTLLIIWGAWFYLFSGQINRNAGQKQMFQFDKVEVADNTPKQMEGLMYRTELCEKCGMLFVFQDEQDRGFWMKNTYLPLDMIFINANGQVSNILQAEPDPTPKEASAEEKKIKQDSLPVYKSEGKVKYVLETNKGWAQKNGLDKGEYINVNHLIEQSKK